MSRDAAGAPRPPPGFRERYGPWALVAGASDGIGACFARRIAAEGVNLLLLARREARLEELAAELRSAHGVEARGVALDLVSADLDAKVHAATRDLEIGLLVYNAGAVHGGRPFHDHPVEHALGLIALNCTGPVLLAHRLGARMRPRGRGGIVLLGSMIAFAGSAYVAAYSATKAFDRILAEGLWHELKPHGVDVLAVIAGATRTPAMLATSQAFATFPGALDPDDVARGALAFLGRGPVWVPGATNRATAKALSPVPRIPQIEAMSRATAGIYGLPHAPAAGVEFADGEDGAP
jgi:short-subunit dehydrogenase